MEKKIRDPERTKEAILKAAVEEFVEHGYHGARMQVIADRARVNKAMIYYYFKNKNTVYGEIIYRGKEMILVNLERIKNDDMPVEEKIGEIFDAYVEVFADERGYFRLLAYEVLRGGKEVIRHLSENTGRIPYHPVTGNIYKYFEKKMKKNEIRRVNILQLIVSIVSQAAPVYLARSVFENVTEKMGIGRTLFKQMVKGRKKFVINLVMEGLEKKDNISK